jgi:3-oxoacyl-[acyl-carrier protein] reductase
MNIIITGASRGIGFELVKILSNDKTCKIFATARNQQKLNELKLVCNNDNGNNNVIAIACDLQNQSETTALVSSIKNEVDEIDVLINNAGMLVNKPFAEITSDDLEKMFQVNVFSVVQLIQKALPLLTKSKKSHVVNISSMGGFQGATKFAGLSSYSSSKAALACLTECLAEEMKESNIRFNCLALGAAQTEMLEEAFPGYKAPLSASQMAEFIAQFSLTAHHYLNGKIIPVSLSNP